MKRERDPNWHEGRSQKKNRRSPIPKSGGKIKKRSYDREGVLPAAGNREIDVVRAGRKGGCCSITDEYGMTKFDSEFFKKTVKIVATVFVIAILATLYYNNRWKLWMDVQYIGSYGDGENRFYKYEITNTTKRTLKEVTVTFKVDNAGYGFKDFTFDDRINVFGTMKAGETAVVDVTWNRVKAEAAEHGTELLMADVEIEKITYR